MNATVKIPTTLDPGNVENDLPLKEVYLHPGQMYLSTNPAQISMILGSCVGVCLYDRRRSIGGATHYMLPTWDGVGQPSPRYGDLAVKSLVKQLLAHGSQTIDLEASIFGGACMFEVFRENGSDDHIGSRNVNTAMEELFRFGIVIAAKDTGGEDGRKVKMQTHTGLVVISPIRNS